MVEPLHNGVTPAVGFTPESRAGMYSDYVELVKERYRENGDIDLSKSLASRQLKIVWGVTRVNGSEVVIRYPPERVPGMERVRGKNWIVNPSEIIAQDAIESIKAETGQDVSRDALQILPLPGRTAGAFKAGQPVPYLLRWVDKNGLPQTLAPGRAWAVDPKVLLEKQSEATLQRLLEFTAAQRLPTAEQKPLRDYYPQGTAPRIALTIDEVLAGQSGRYERAQAPYTGELSRAEAQRAGAEELAAVPRPAVIVPIEEALNRPMPRGR